LYGVETKVVQKTQQRFIFANAACPKNFEEKLEHSKEKLELKQL